jgi:hypothetical protein
MKRSKPLRKRALLRSTRVEDSEYLAWVAAQPSLVSMDQVSDADLRAIVRSVFGSGPVGINAMRLILSGVEVHHHKPGDDHSTVPLFWWLHRETKISIHGGGGRRKFAERFLEPMGKTWESEIARLNALYESKTGKRAA